MNKTFKSIAAIVVLGVIVSIAVVNKSDNSSSTPLKIGLISILSGEYSVVGENVRNGAILALEEHNVKHPDTPVTLTVEDDGYDPKKALSAYQKLVGIDKVDGLINVSTASIGAIYGLVSQVEMPVIQGGEQPVEPTKDNVFQLLAGNIELEKQLGIYIKSQNFKNPVVVYTNNDTMIRFKNAFIQGYGESITEFTINGDEKDFAPHVLKVSQTNPDVIILLSFPQSGAQFLKEYISTKGKLPQIAFDANAQSGFEDYKRILNGGAVLNGSIIATVSSKISDEFKVAYKNRFGNEPGVFADIGYDAFNVLMKTHNKDGKKWIKNVENSNISGVSGKIEFDTVGVRKPEVNIVRIADGKIPTN